MEQEVGNDNELVKPTWKKARTSRSKKAADVAPVNLTYSAPKKRAGKLAMLPEMPLDVLYEIFRNLPPYELLRLARTTKSLRSVLLNRNARSVWIDALNAVPALPPCPQDMSEPAYTRLAFDTHCSFCLGAGAQGTIWVWRLRTCRKCLDDVAYTFSPGSRSLFLRNASNEQHRDLVASVYVGQYFTLAGGNRWHQLRYLRSEVEEVCSALDALDAGPPENKAAYIEQRKSALLQRKIHSTACQEWCMSTKSGRADELRAARTSRKEAIVRNLRDLGFAHELDFINADFVEAANFSNLKNVRMSKALTQRVWANMKGRMIDHMEGVRTRRLVALREEVVGQRIEIVRKFYDIYTQEHPTKAARPRLVDICQMPSFLDALEVDVPEAVSADTVTQDTFQDAFDALPALESEWRARCLSHLESLLQSHMVALLQNPEYAGPDITTLSSHTEHATLSRVPRLDLAAALFKSASTTGRRVRLRGVEQTLRAHCTPYDHHSLERTIVTRRTSEYHWNHDGCISVDSAGIQAVSQVLQLCGGKVDITTSAEMDDMDPKFQCNACIRENGFRDVFGWKEAVEHWSSSSQGYYHPTAVLVRLSPDEEREARRLEISQVMENIMHNHWLRDWECAHCDNCHSKTSGQVIDHLLTAHGIAQPMRVDLGYSTWVPPYQRVQLPPVVETTPVS